MRIYSLYIQAEPANLVGSWMGQLPRKVVSYEWVINLGIGMLFQTSCANMLSLNWV